MDFIPIFKFIASLIMFGLLMFIYNPVITFLHNDYPTSGVYATAMFWIWGILAAVVLFGSGINLIMEMQRRKGYA